MSVRLLEKDGRLYREMWNGNPYTGSTRILIDVGPALPLPPSPTQQMIDRIRKEQSCCNGNSTTRESGPLSQG